MDQFHDQIMHFQRQANDYLDDKSSQAAKSLQNEIQKLEDEVQIHKNPKSVENRVQSVMRCIEQASEAGVMSHGHADELNDECKHFVQQLRKM